MHLKIFSLNPFLIQIQNNSLQGTRKFLWIFEYTLEKKVTYISYVVFLTRERERERERVQNAIPLSYHSIPYQFLYKMFKFQIKKIAMDSFQCSQFIPLFPSMLLLRSSVFNGRPYCYSSVSVSLLLLRSSVSNGRPYCFC